MIGIPIFTTSALLHGSGQRYREEVLAGIPVEGGGECKNLS